MPTASMPAASPTMAERDIDTSSPAPMQSIDVTSSQEHRDDDELDRRDHRNNGPANEDRYDEAPDRRFAGDRRPRHEIKGNEAEEIAKAGEPDEQIHGVEDLDDAPDNVGDEHETDEFVW